MNSPFHLDVNSLMKSRVATIFSPVNTGGNINLFNFSDFINSTMINKGKKLNKVGHFEPSEIGTPSQLKTIKTPFELSNTHSFFKNSFNTNENQKNKKEFNSIFFPKDSKEFNYADKLNGRVTLIKSSIIPSALINHTLEFTKLKRRRFITTNRPKSSDSFNLDGNLIEDKEKKYKIETNKMTKKLIDENIFNPQSFFSHPSNNNNEINASSLQRELKVAKLKKEIFFEELKSSINYHYLLEPFSCEIDNSFSFNDLHLLTSYKNFHLNTVQTEKNYTLSFGEDPINKFREWLTWLNQEKEKEKSSQSVELCDDIAKTLNSITTIMSSLPIFIFPGHQPGQRNNFNGILKYKKKKEDEENSGDKIFYCDFCSETFTSGQGLGGHMSRKHKDQSLKFKHKKEVRNKREPLRRILVQAKKILCKNHLLDFEEHIKTKQGKVLIKKLIHEFNEEYRRIKNELKRALLITTKKEEQKIN